MSTPPAENEEPLRATRPRGRPRSERARTAVLDAAADILLECGVSAVTMEAVVARAGVSKATVYKWWPSLAHVMLESLFSRTRSSVEVAADDSLAEALTAQLGALTRLFRDGAVGPLIREVVAAAQGDPGIRDALDARWLRPRRQAARRLLTDAMERHELRADTDVEAAVDQLFAPVYHRLLFAHAPLSDRLGETLVCQLLDGLRPAGRASAPATGSGEAGSPVSSVAVGPVPAASGDDSTAGPADHGAGGAATAQAG